MCDCYWMTARRRHCCHNKLSAMNWTQTSAMRAQWGPWCSFRVRQNFRGFRAPIWWCARCCAVMPNVPYCICLQIKEAVCPQMRQAPGYFGQLCVCSFLPARTTVPVAWLNQRVLNSDTSRDQLVSAQVILVVQDGHIEDSYLHVSRCCCSATMDPMKVCEMLYRH